MISTPVFIVGVFAGGLLTLVVLLAFQHRLKRQMTGLMGRLDELERTVPVFGGDEKPATAAGENEAELESDRETGLNPSRDVLAGRTSFVRRAVEGELSLPTSLAGQTIALVHSKIEARLSPTELAGELAISLRTLERGLAAELGCTPRQLISAMKMREARRMLVSGKYRVNEVALRLGFATPSHFSRCFRTFYRTPPSELARRARTSLPDTRESRRF